MPLRKHLGDESTAIGGELDANRISEKPTGILTQLGERSFSGRAVIVEKVEGWCGGAIRTVWQTLDSRLVHRPCHAVVKNVEWRGLMVCNRDTHHT